MTATNCIFAVSVVDATLGGARGRPALGPVIRPLLRQAGYMSAREYKRDLRWPVGIAMSMVGVTVALLTRWLNGDSWREFAVVGAYSVGWALITFAILYVLGRVFEDWEWGREDHDLVKKYKESST